MTKLEFWRTYGSNIDLNLNSENTLHVAELVGDNWQIGIAKSIIHEHNRLGYMSDSLFNKRNKLDKDLKPLLLDFIFND